MLRNELAACAVFVMGCCLNAQALTLVDSGRAKATIYVRAGAADEVKDAAADPSRVLKIMSGAEPAVLEVANADAVPAGPAILLDALAEQAGLRMNKTSRAKDGFRYAVRRGRLLIVAESPRGIYLGTSRFLETLGRGWFKPDFEDSGRRDMGTYSTSWVDEGLTWYHGDAWYRVRFDLPADAKGKDLRPWFGGFDNNVDVYLNGRSLGEKTGFVEPQEYTGIGEHLNFGGSNVIAVRVSSGGLAEIGTGGIMMPVMIYRPANERGG